MRRNQNQLDNLRCPQCGSFGPFYITVIGTAEVVDEGYDSGDVTDLDWDSSSSCACKNCTFSDMVNGFEDQALGHYNHLNSDSDAKESDECIAAAFAEVYQILESRDYSSPTIVS